MKTTLQLQATTAGNYHDNNELSILLRFDIDDVIRWQNRYMKILLSTWRPRLLSIQEHTARMEVTSVQCFHHKIAANADENTAQLSISCYIIFFNILQVCLHLFKKIQQKFLNSCDTCGREVDSRNFDFWLPVTRAHISLPDSRESDGFASTLPLPLINKGQTAPFCHFSSVKEFLTKAWKAKRNVIQQHMR